MDKDKLKRLALNEAAALIGNKASAMDLDAELGVEEENFVREYLRVEIPRILYKLAQKG